MFILNCPITSWVTCSKCANLIGCKYSKSWMKVTFCRIITKTGDEDLKSKCSEQFNQIKVMEMMEQLLECLDNYIWKHYLYLRNISVYNKLFYWLKSSREVPYFKSFIYFKIFSFLLFLLCVAGKGKLKGKVILLFYCFSHLLMCSAYKMLLTTKNIYYCIWLHQNKIS